MADISEELTIINETNQNNVKTLTTIGQVVSVVLIVLFIVYGLNQGLFSSEEKLATWVTGFGMWAPIALTFYVGLQVVIPILPGGTVLILSPILFGPIRGFLYSYTGIVIGSVISFLIAKRYGTIIMSYILNEKNQKFFDRFIGGENFERNYVWTVLLPGFPDDYLSYLAGTTKMSLATFISIILPAKVPLLLLYSYGINSIYKFLIGIAGF